MLLLSRFTSQNGRNGSNSIPADKIREPANYSNKDSIAAAEPAPVTRRPDIPTYLLNERDWVRQFGY